MTSYDYLLVLCSQTTGRYPFSILKTTGRRQSERSTQKTRLDCSEFIISFFFPFFSTVVVYGFARSALFVSGTPVAAAVASAASHWPTGRLLPCPRPSARPPHHARRRHGTHVLRFPSAETEFRILTDNPIRHS